MVHFKLSEQQRKYLDENAAEDVTIDELSARLKVDYKYIHYYLKTRFLPFKIIKVRRNTQERRRSPIGEFFNVNIRENWMV